MPDLELTAHLDTSQLKSALSDAALTGANAFNQLAEAIESGNFAGLAELIGGPVAGALVAAAQAAFDFVEAQAKAVVELNALAEAGGTSLEAMQGLRDGLERAGFTGERAMRALSQATLRLTNDNTELAQKVRDQGLAEESTGERAVAATQRVIDAKEELGELQDHLAQQSQEDALGQEQASLRLARAEQHQQDLLTGRPDKAANALLDQRQAALDVSSALQNVGKQNLKSADDDVKGDRAVRDKEQEVIRAGTAAREAENAQLKAHEGSFQTISKAIDGVGPLADKLKDIKPVDLKGAEELRATERTGAPADLPQIIRQLLIDRNQLTQGQIEGTARNLGINAGRGQEAALAEFAKNIKEGNEDKVLGVQGPKLTADNVAASQSFIDGVNQFKAAAADFGQRAASEFIGALKGGGGAPSAPGKAGGGPIHGPGSGTSDTAGIFALSHGEFVMRAAAVQKYGVDMFHALNGLAMPGFALGGLVSPIRMANGGAVPASSVLNLTIDGNHFNGLRAPDHVASKIKTYAINSRTTQTGDMPSWVR